jgi:transposase-like protein
MVPASNDDIAFYAAVLGGAIFGAWKIYLRIRQDHRWDRSEEQQHKGYGGLIDRYQEEIIDLRERNEKLERDNAELEDANAELRRRLMNPTTTPVRTRKDENHD